MERLEIVNRRPNANGPARRPAVALGLQTSSRQRPFPDVRGRSQVGPIDGPGVGRRLPSHVIPLAPPPTVEKHVG